MAPDETEQWIGITNAAAHFSVSRETMYRWIRDKDLPGHQVGNLFRFKISELDRWARIRQPKRALKRELMVLLVEDDDMDVKSFKRLIQDKNYQVVVAKDGKSALNILHNMIPDLIFLDLNLPLMDGVSVLNEIKNQDEWRDIPVICITGFNGQLKKVLKLSPITVISKPLTQEKIDEALKLAVWNNLKVKK